MKRVSKRKPTATMLSQAAQRKVAPLSLGVFVKNLTSRKGVPLSASFERWIRAALAGRRGGRTEVNIVILDEAAAREMNRQYRRKDYATNILSFAYPPSPHQKLRLLGDLAICAPVVAREAIEQQKSSRDHYAHLTVHGVLHLLGFDHEKSAEAVHMEALEREMLAKLGIADPYS